MPSLNELPESTREKLRILREANVAVRDEMRRERAGTPPPAAEEEGDAEDDAPEVVDEARTPAAPAVAYPAAGAAVPVGDAPAAGSAPVTDERDARLAAAQERIATEARRTEALRDEAKKAQEITEAAAVPLRTFGAEYTKDSLGAIRTLLATSLGLSEDDVKDEMNHLFDEMTRQVLGVAADSTHKATSDSARLRREFRHFKQSEQTAKIEAERAAGEREYQARRERAIDLIGKDLTATADTAPFLMAEESPASIVFGVIEAEFRQSGRELTVAEAAKLADSNLKTHAERFVGKRRSLLSPLLVQEPPPAGAPKPSSGEASKSSPSTSDRPRTLTNATASATPTSPPKKSKKPVYASSDDEKRAVLARVLGARK